jgi:Tfp pilus assembly protein PilE
MVWAPKEETRTAIKFWLDCLQVVTVAGGVLAALITWSSFKAETEKARLEQVNRALARLDLEEQRHKEQEQRAKDQEQRAIEQEKRSKEQLEATKRELQRPYQERKLSLYLDASRVLAHLAATPDVNKDATEARFWELYWGELAFVESTVSEEERKGPKPSVERLMVLFCHQYFTPQRCVKGGSGGPDPKSATGSVKLMGAPGEIEAIDLARHASKEIRDEWEKLGK